MLFFWLDVLGSLWLDLYIEVDSSERLVDLLVVFAWFGCFLFVFSYIVLS